jgi:hypothetical protein
MIKILSVGGGSCSSQKGGEGEQNTSSYENTMETPVICMEAEANQVHKEVDRATKKE